ncbi:MAG: FAD-dependent oxidoreductase [Actinobacteria bacterium]|nr:FAD-dependent oxidoreductase [Actinomycetota bacterium]
MITDFPYLLGRTTIGGIDLMNHLVSAPIGTANADPEGHVTQRNIDYYKALAAGGTGLIIVESSYFDNVACKGEDGQIGCVDGSHTPGLALLAKTIHDYYGIKCFIQLTHEGQQISLVDRLPSWGPSDLTLDINGGTIDFVGMTKEQIDQVVEDFATAAWRAKIAGFDGVEIHSSGGHLLNMFLSPTFNKRQDEFGGSIENRVRLLTQIIDAVRARCGKDFPLCIRWCGDEYDEGGLHIDESIEAAKIIDGYKVAALSVTGGSLSNGIPTPTMFDELATFRSLTRAMKQGGVKTPLMVAGSITSPELAEDILASGDADFIALGRPLLADPNWIKKLRAGAPEDIVPCIRCGHGCVGTYEEYLASKGLNCAVNPLCNYTGHRQINTMDKKKKVAIIGGGPGGMECARVAALRGHDVTLYERRKLGGVLNEAAFDTKIKGDIQFLIDYYVAQMEKTDNIRIVDRDVTASYLLEGGDVEYDAVVCATGAHPRKLRIPGIDKPNVFTELDATGPRAEEIGQNVIVCGGGISAAEVAISQAMKGKNVILTTRRGAKMMQWEIASDDSAPTWQRIVNLLDSTGVELELMAVLKEITDTGVILTDISGDDYSVEGDSVVVCSGWESEDAIYRLLYLRMDEVYLIGDAVKPGKIGDAVHAGWSVGNQI